VAAALQAAVGRRGACGAGHADVAVVHLAADALRRWDADEQAPDQGAPGAGAPGAGAPGDERPLTALRDAPVLAAAGVGDPAAFAAQLAAAGARVELARYADHHAYTAADAATLALRAERAGLLVTTLKDAVKLGPLWPRGAAPLWYVTQRVTVERGAEALAARLDAVAAAARARLAHAPTP
jgi:tetraacyldisaccharide 4'-kinase